MTISNLAVNANFVARCECDASAPVRGRYAPAPRDDVRSDAARRRPAPRVVGAAFSALRVDAHKLLLAVPPAAGGVLQAAGPTDDDRVEVGAVEHLDRPPAITVSRHSYEVLEDSLLEVLVPSMVVHEVFHTHRGAILVPLDACGCRVRASGR